MCWMHQTAPAKPSKHTATFDSRLTFSLLWPAMAKLYFYYSSMNAGKSTALLQSSYNYKERGMSTLVLAPDLDDRYGAGKVTSRIGIEAEATTGWSDAEILENWGVFLPVTGYRKTQHFLDRAEGSGLIELWEHRGPPDYCSKDTGEWVCQ